jgi:hypothetical protein
MTLSAENVDANARNVIARQNLSLKLLSSSSPSASMTCALTVCRAAFSGVLHYLNIERIKDFFQMTTGGPLVAP